MSKEEVIKYVEHTDNYEENLMSLTTDVADVTNKLKSYHKELEEKMVARDNILEELEEKMVARDNISDSRLYTANRPAFSSASGTKNECSKKMVNSYLRGGQIPSEYKTMNTQIASTGGMLLGKEFANKIDNALRSRSVMRSLARVVNVSSATYEHIMELSGPQGGWISDTEDSITGNIDVDSTPNLTSITIDMHELASVPSISQRLLDDAEFDLEEWLIDRTVSHFAALEDDAFIVGSGSMKPKGILSYLKHAGAGNVQWGRTSYISTGNATGFPEENPMDSILDLIYALPVVYRHGAVFLMNSEVASVIRKWKDNEGRYLWSDMQGNDLMPHLLGYPVVISESMQGIDAGGYPVCFGNFKHAYTIIERPDIRILRDQYSQKPYVQFYISKRIGGGITDFNALRLLRCE